MKDVLQKPFGNEDDTSIAHRVQNIGGRKKGSRLYRNN